MISKNEVKYIAHLSRIHLNDKEVERIGKNLEDILSYIAKLNKLDVSNIKPTSHVLNLKNVFREDVSKPSLDQKSVIDMTSFKRDGSFSVPQVIE